MREPWIEDLRDQGEIVTQHVRGEENLADIFTKCLKGPVFRKMVSMIKDFQKVQILQEHVYLVGDES